MWHGRVTNLASAAPTEHRGVGLSALSVTSQANSQWIRNSRDMEFLNSYKLYIPIIRVSPDSIFWYESNEKRRILNAWKWREEKRHGIGMWPFSHLVALSRTIWFPLSTLRPTVLIPTKRILFNHTQSRVRSVAIYLYFPKPTQTVRAESTWCFMNIRAGILRPEAGSGFNRPFSYER